MDLGVLVELISTLGFPIVSVIVLAWFIFKIYKQSVEREGLLMAEIQENRKINAQAIETISLYAERLTHIEDNVAEIRNDVILIKDKVAD